MKDLKIISSHVTFIITSEKECIISKMFEIWLKIVFLFFSYQLRIARKKRWNIQVNETYTIMRNKLGSIINLIGKLL